MENIIEQFNPGPHHRLVIDHIKKNRFSVIMNSDQTGITRSYAMFLLEYLLNNPGKTAVVSSHKALVAQEVRDIMVELFDNMPENKDEEQITRYGKTISFRGEGINILVRNQKVVKFSNGSELRVYVAHKNTQLSVSVDCFILMDMAHIINSEVKPLYTHMYTMLSSREDSRMILNSSPNGVNLFYEIFTNAELPEDHPKKNSFAPLRLYFWQVPGRDGEWVKEQIREIGEDLFNQRYNLCMEDKFKNAGFWFPTQKQLPDEIIGYDVTFKYRKNE